MEQKNTRTKKSVLLFVLCAVLLQGIFCLFFTTDALETSFPLYVRLASQEVSVGDNSYTEYFHLRNEAVDSDIIVVGIDFSSPQTFDVLMDMIVSLKHDANIGGVVIDAFGDAASSVYAAEAFNSIMPDVAEYLCMEMRESYDVPVAYEEFLDRICTINLGYPQARSMFGVAIEDNENHTAALLSCAHRAWEESQRPVLVLTDSTRLAMDDPYRVGAEASGDRYLFVRFICTNGVWDSAFSYKRCVG